MSMQFANGIGFTLFPIAAALILLIVRLERRHRIVRLAKFADPHLLHSLLPEGQASSRRGTLVAILVFLLFTTLAVCRPQWGFVTRETTKRGVDIAVALDVSESMLANDVNPSRLERARREIYDLLEELRGDRVGLISFAGAAFVETPLTLDYAALRLFAQSIDTSAVPVQGTNIELAVRTAIDLLRAGGDRETTKGRSRVLVLITDGEQLDGDVSTAVDLLKENKIHLFILGVGTPAGIPLQIGGQFKRDSKHNLVMTKLNEESLRTFADAAGGRYLREVATGDDTRAIYREGIELLAEGTLSSGDARIWNEYFQIPLACAIAILLFAAWRESRERGVTTAATLLLLMLSYSAPAQADSRELLRKGAIALEQGDFEEAEAAYAEAAKAVPDDPHARLGLGAAQYRLGKFSESGKTFREAASLAKEAKIKSEALYNAGNADTQLGSLEQAVSTYKQALTLNRDDRDTRDNLRYVEKLLKQQQKSQQEKEEQKEQEQGNPKENNQQQEEQQNQKGQQQEEQKNSEQQQEERKQDKQESEQQKQGQEGEEEAPTPRPAETAQPSPDPSPAQSPGETPSPQAGSGEAQELPEDSATPQPEHAARGSERSPSPEPSENPSSAPSGEPSQAPSETPDEQRDGEAASEEEKSEEKHGTPQASDKEPAKPLTPDEQALETLLGSLQERSTPNQSYRLKEGLIQLRQHKQPRPQRDW